jgi:putative hydrolase of the HAD superfamily
LFKVEIDNLKLYGGIKGYILSMIEAAMTISNNTIPIEIVEKIIQFGKNCFKNQSFYLMVEETLDSLFGKYKLVVATKSLLDQRRNFIIQV